MRLYTALVILALAACGTGPHPRDTLRPIGLEGWSEVVQRSVDTWANALGPKCPRYFVAERGRFYVKLVSTYDWHYTATGRYNPGKGILIRGDRITGRQRQLIHELGHGIFGNWHSLNPRSIMYPQPTVNEPSPEDIWRARRKLHCEP